MVKRKNSFFKAFVLLVAPTIFFLSFAFIVMLFVLDVRSFSDIVELKYLIVGSITLMVTSIVTIKATGIAIKRVLRGWLGNYSHWLIP